MRVVWRGRRIFLLQPCEGWVKILRILSSRIHLALIDLMYGSQEWRKWNSIPKTFISSTCGILLLAMTKRLWDSYWFATWLLEDNEFVFRVKMRKPHMESQEWILGSAACRMRRARFGWLERRWFRFNRFLTFYIINFQTTYYRNFEWFTREIFEGYSCTFQGENIVQTIPPIRAASHQWRSQEEGIRGLLNESFFSEFWEPPVTCSNISYYLIQSATAIVFVNTVLSDNKNTWKLPTFQYLLRTLTLA